MTRGLLAGQKQRLCRTSRAGRRCCARSASSSRVPLTLRMLCWPSSANERLTSSFSHRPNSPPPPPAANAALLPPDFGTGTDGKAWRKLFWKRGKRIKLFESCKQVTTSMKICLFHTTKEENRGIQVTQGLIPFAGSLGSHGTRRGSPRERTLASEYCRYRGPLLRPASSQSASESCWAKLSRPTQGRGRREHCILKAKHRPNCLGVFQWNFFHLNADVSRTFDLRDLNLTPSGSFNKV